VDRIGVGDGLTVTVFDRGPEALFATSGVTNGIGGVTVNGIPKLFVNTQGDIILPYGGQIHVAGLTVAEAGSAIQDALKGKAINPQVVVSITDNIANSVTVVGEVRSPGRYALADGSDHILDMLALAGGAGKPPEDVNVVVVRGMAQATASLSDLLSNNSQNIRLAPHDQVRLFYTPRKFSTFGALMRSAQIPIEDPSLTLAAALSKAGGLDPDAANASSVLLFRFERPQVAAALALNAPVSAKGVPIVYHVNMRNPEEMFVANRFEIKSGDIIYVPRTDIAEMKQFLAIVTAASNVAYNIRVTTAVVP
jgi:polysaccharide export outer membrane protein